MYTCFKFRITPNTRKCLGEGKASSRSESENTVATHTHTQTQTRTRARSLLHTPDACASAQRHTTQQVLLNYHSHQRRGSRCPKHLDIMGSHLRKTRNCC